MSVLSPLRYPGGKAKLAGLLADTLGLGESSAVTWVEPFAGGAGAGLTLARSGRVKAVRLADTNVALAAFWSQVATDATPLIERLRVTPTITVADYQNAAAVCIAAQQLGAVDPVELAWAALVVNRGSRSGIVPYAGPIGGLGQTGRYTVAARWYPETLRRRLEVVGQLNLQATCADACTVIADAGDDAVVFADPPYVEAGHRLYRSGWSPHDHLRLAATLRAARVPWVLTYDDAPLIRQLYDSFTTTTVPMTYSANRRSAAVELVITNVTPKHGTGGFIGPGKARTTSSIPS